MAFDKPCLMPESHSYANCQREKMRQGECVCECIVDSDLTVLTTQQFNVSETGHDVWLSGLQSSERGCKPECPRCPAVVVHADKTHTVNG